MRRRVIPAALALAVCLGPAITGAARAPQAPSRVVVEELTSKIFGNTRGIRVYLPPGYDAEPTRRYPVLYLNDGFAVFAARSWNAPATLDTLLAAGRIAPIMLVGIDNAASIDGAKTPLLDRAREYLPYRDPSEPELTEPAGLTYPSFVVDEVMPFVQARFRTADGPANTAIGGSSYGALAALVTVQQRPGVFGQLILESAPLFLFDGRLLDETAAMRTWPDVVYIGKGSAETEDPEINRIGDRAFNRFVDLVRTHAPHTRLKPHVVAGATHSSAAWRERLPTALEHLFPPRRAMPR